MQRQSTNGATNQEASATEDGKRTRAFSSVPTLSSRGERVIHARSLRSYLGMTLNQQFLRTMAVASLA